jgi:UDP-glucose 4-epimerase
MRCLVLGGAGFIGSHLVDALLEQGHEVRVFDLPNVNTRNLVHCEDRIEFCGGDFYNEKELAPALKGVDTVVHLVCATLPGSSNENPAYDVECNVVGSLNLLEEAVRSGVKKVIFASSGGTVYGIPTVLPIPETHETNPICSYGITKLTIEKYLGLYHHLKKLDYVVLRFGNPYGPRQKTDSSQGAIAVFLGRLLGKKPITIWGDGSAARDYFHISDLVAAFVRVIQMDTKSKIYNISGGRAYSLNEILTVLREVTGEDARVEYVEGRKLDVPINCLDIRRARQELGWSPRIEIRAGVADLWQRLEGK